MYLNAASSSASSQYLKLRFACVIAALPAFRGVRFSLSAREFIWGVHGTVGITVMP